MRKRPLLEIGLLLTASSVIVAVSGCKATPPANSAATTGSASTSPSTPASSPSTAASTTGTAPTANPNSAATPAAPSVPAPPKRQADINVTSDQSMPGKSTGSDVDMARKNIEALYAKQNRAIAAEDAKMAMSVYDTDWGKVHINGKKSELGRQQMFFNRMFAKLKQVHAATTIRQFSLDGKVAYSTVRLHLCGRTNSNRLKKDVWTYADFISKDEWEKQANGGWLMVSNTILKRVRYADDHTVTANGITLPAGIPNDQTPAPAPSDELIDAVK